MKIRGEYFFFSCANNQQQHQQVEGKKKLFIIDFSIAFSNHSSTASMEPALVIDLLTRNSQCNPYRIHRRAQSTCFMFPSYNYVCQMCEVNLIGSASNLHAMKTHACLCAISIPGDFVCIGVIVVVVVVGAAGGVGVVAMYTGLSLC